MRTEGPGGGRPGWRPRRSNSRPPTAPSFGRVADAGQRRQADNPLVPLVTRQRRGSRLKTRTRSQDGFGVCYGGSGGRPTEENNVANAITTLTTSSSVGFFMREPLKLRSQRVDSAGRRHSNCEAFLRRLPWRVSRTFPWPTYCDLSVGADFWGVPPLPGEMAIEPSVTP